MIQSADFQPRTSTFLYVPNDNGVKEVGHDNTKIIIDDVQLLYIS